MLRKMTPTLAASALLLAAAAANAQPVTIDFSNYASPVTAQYQAFVGAPVTQHGFEFYAAFGVESLNSLATWGTDPSSPLNGEQDRPSNVGTSTPLFAEQMFERIDMFDANLSAFHLYSIDVAHLYAQSELDAAALGQRRAITMRFFGYHSFEDWLNDTPTTFEDFVIPPPTADRPFLNTLTFDPSFASTYALTWYNTSVLSDAPDPNGFGPFTGSLSLRDASQFTNVVVQAAPEPSSVVLLVSGALVLLGAERRRRRSA